MRFLKLNITLSVVVLAACGEKTQQINTPKTTHSTTSAAPTVKNQTVIVQNNQITQYKTDSIVPKQYEEPPFEPFRSLWSKALKPGHYLYCPKVDSLVKLHTKRYASTENDFGGYDMNVLNKTILETLTPKELTYYCLAYPSCYAQNCSFFGIPTNRKVFIPFLPAPEEGTDLSKLQYKYLDKIDSLLPNILDSALSNSDTIPFEFLNLIQSYNITKFIPFLCEHAGFYNDSSYYYTVLIYLLEQGRYKPFLHSGLYNRIKNVRDEYGYIPVKDAHCETLIKFAMAYYQTIHSNETNNSSIP